MNRAFFRALCRLAAFPLLVTLAGCAERVYLKAYDGPELPADAVVWLKAQRGIIIRSIDGDPRKEVWTMGVVRAGVDADIALQSGAHSFVLEYNDGIYSTKKPVWLSYYFNAGRKYIIQSEFGTVQYRPLNWVPRVQDVTDTPELWCYYPKGSLRGVAKDLCRDTSPRTRPE